MYEGTLAGLVAVCRASLTSGWSNFTSLSSDCNSAPFLFRFETCPYWHKLSRSLGLGKRKHGMFPLSFMAVMLWRNLLENERLYLHEGVQGFRRTDSYAPKVSFGRERRVGRLSVKLRFCVACGSHPETQCLINVEMSHQDAIVPGNSAPSRSLAWLFPKWAYYLIIHSWKDWARLEYAAQTRKCFAFFPI